MKKLKGSSLLTVVIVLAIAAVVGAVIYFLGKGGFGLGGGKGDGEGDGNAEEVQQVMVTVQESTTIEVTTKEIEYVEVTVHETTYLYNNKVYEIDEINSLIDNIKNSEGRINVRITDDNAASKAYSQLISELEDNMITYIELSE
ncbi:hypothetical protein [Huintestinicola sp.]|uniref:hypothetical protein n=1 Tax=Huintestinicola sp. TaxID=2981661 RepID=UPI003D7DA7FA